MAHRGIAIFGFYRSAVEVAHYLSSSQHDVVIIDNNEENLSKARDTGFATAKIDYRDDAELKQLELGKSIDTIFSLFPDDAENVFLTISIRAIAPAVKIFTISHDPDAALKLHAAGADKVIDTNEISGRRIWDILHRPIVTEILDSTLFGRWDLQIAEIPLPQACFLDQRHIHDIDLSEHYNLILLGVVDKALSEHFVFNTRGYNHKLDTGDILVVIGPSRDIARLTRDLAAHPGSVRQA